MWFVQTYDVGSQQQKQRQQKQHIRKTNMFRWKLWQLLSCAISFFAFFFRCFYHRCRCHHVCSQCHLSAHHFRGECSPSRNLFVSVTRRTCGARTHEKKEEEKTATRWNRLNLILFHDLCWYLMCVRCTLDIETILHCSSPNLVRFLVATATTVASAPQCVRNFMHLFIGFIHKTHHIHTCDRRSELDAVACGLLRWNRIAFASNTTILVRHYIPLTARGTADGTPICNNISIVISNRCENIYPSTNGTNRQADEKPWNCFCYFFVFSLKILNASNRLSFQLYIYSRDQWEHFMLVRNICR